MSKKKSYKPGTAGSPEGDIFGSLNPRSRSNATGNNAPASGNNSTSASWLESRRSKPLVSGDRSLTTNKGGKVGRSYYDPARVEERQRKQAARQQRQRGQTNYLPPDPNGLSQDARDMIAMQNNMMMPSRGFKRGGGDKPDFLGGGLDQFYANNPTIARGPDRAVQIAQERQQQLSRGFENGRAAVQEKLAEQQMLQDNAGQNRSIDRGYGIGSVEFLPPGQRARGTMTNPITGKKVFMDEYLPKQSRIQDTKYGVMPGQENGGALARSRVQSQPPQSQPKSPNLSGIDQIFPQQSSPPGGGNAGLVGTGVTQGAPGGDFSRGVMPNVQGAGMFLPPQALPDDTPGAASRAARAKAFPQDRMTTYQPPNSSPEQLKALQTLQQLFGTQSPALAGLESSWTNIFPGVKDWDYLAQLFPDLVQPGAGASVNMRNLAKLYQDPVYQSRF